MAGNTPGWGKRGLWLSYDRLVIPSVLGQWVVGELLLLQLTSHAFEKGNMLFFQNIPFFPSKYIEKPFPWTVINRLKKKPSFLLFPEECVNTRAITTPSGGSARFLLLDIDIPWHPPLISSVTKRPANHCGLLLSSSLSHHTVYITVIPFL